MDFKVNVASIGLDSATKITKIARKLEQLIRIVLIVINSIKWSRSVQLPFVSQGFVIGVFNLDLREVAWTVGCYDARIATKVYQIDGVACVHAKV